MDGGTPDDEAFDFDALEQELHLGAAREAVESAGTDAERATALASLGAVAAFAEQSDEARAAALEALGAAQRAGDAELLLRVRAARLSVHQCLGDDDAVLHELAELAAHCEELGRWDLVTVWMGALSDSAGATGDVEDALRYLDRAKVAAARSRDPLLMAKVAVAHAEWTELAGRIPEALILTEAAVDLLNQVGDGEELAHQRCRLGMLSFRSEDFAAAHDHLLQAQQDFVAVGLTSAGAQLNRNIGAAALHLGRIEEARARLVAALHLAREDFDRVEEGRIALDLGELARLTSDYPGARHWYTVAAAIADELSDAGMAACAGSGLASAACAEGRWQEAVEHAESSLSRSRERDDRFGVVNSLIQLGQLHRLLGEATSSEERLQEALRTATDAGYALGQANASIGLGFLHHQLGALGDAQACFRRALTFAMELEDRVGAANASLGLSMVAVSAGHYEEAAMEAATGLEMAREVGYRRMEQQLLRQLAVGALDRGDPVTARTYLDDAAAIGTALEDPTGMADNDSVLGAVCGMRGDLDAGEAQLRAALSRHRRLEDRAGIAVDLRRLGELRLAAGDPVEAAGLLREAVTELEALGATEELARALTALAATEPDAFEAADRARQLLENLAAGLPTGWDRSGLDERHRRFQAVRATAPRRALSAAA